MAFSPLIKDGALSLNSTGDLAISLDVETQMSVAIGAYHCIYDDTINSGLLPYLETIPVGGFKQNVLTNIIRSAFTPLIQQKIITDLQIAILAQVLSSVTIKISAVDSEGNTPQLFWSNIQ